MPKALTTEVPNEAAQVYRRPGRCCRVADGGGRATLSAINRVLNGQSSAGFTHLVDAFLQGLQETGFVPDRNVRIEYRWAEGRFEKLPLLAAELIGRPVNLIVAAEQSQSYSRLGANPLAKAWLQVSTDQGETRPE